MPRLLPWIALGGLAALTACPARTPNPPPPLPPPPPAIHVPPGCERSQAGDYHHADNPSFRYRGQDDGVTLTLSVQRVREEGANPPDAGSTVSIVLQRTSEGFLGETQATTFTPEGVACPVRFPTRATVCDEQGLTLSAVASTALDENCTPATSGPTPVWKEQRLLRGEPDAGAPDAGVPDAGVPDAGVPAPDAGAPRGP